MMRKSNPRLCCKANVYGRPEQIAEAAGDFVSIFRYESVTMDKYGFAVIDANCYAPAPVSAGGGRQTKGDRIALCHDHQPAGKCRRSYGKNAGTMIRNGILGPC